MARRRPTKFSSLMIEGQTLTQAKTLTRADSGKTFFLNSTTEFAVTLPAPKLGLRFSFFVKGAPSGANYTITTPSQANLIFGHVVTTDVNSATDPDFAASAQDTITIVDGTAIQGDRVDLECDGTYWYATAYCSVYNAITFDVQSSASPSLSPSVSPSLSPSVSPSISPSISPSVSPS